MATLWTRDALERAVLGSFIAEIDALKPGNVHRHADGHGMRYADFLHSARVATPWLCDPDLSLGRRCLEAVRATARAVGTNTNLGMVLLFAPIVCAAQQCGRPEGLRGAFDRVISGAQPQDAADIFAAIALANPGGLGRVPAHDVHSAPDCSLREAMAEAASRDRVARQFVTAAEDIFQVGLPVLERYSRGPVGVEWPPVYCYLTLLAGCPDSHVRRKHGPEVAELTSRRAAEALAWLETQTDPGNMTRRLLGLDRDWKDAGINPGTTADLTAACLLLQHLGVTSAMQGTVHGH